MYVSRSLPEISLLCALLERAVKDLDITVANGHNNLKSAIAWFYGRYDLLSYYDPPEFTFLFVAEELRLSTVTLKRINKMVKRADKFVNANPGMDPGKHTTLIT